MHLIDDRIMQGLFAEAAVSERKRAHYLLHKTHQEKVQRLVIAMVKGSYVDPHYHELPHQWEMFVVMQGSVEVKLYNHDGTVRQVFIAGPQHHVTVIEFAPGDIHSVECLSERASMMEVKEGPFDVNYAKASPPWLL